jgi:hypothetical protein
MNLNIDELKEQEKKLDYNYKKQDEEMLRFRELITKKYFKDDEEKQSEMKRWRTEIDEELEKSNI